MSRMQMLVLSAAAALLSLVLLCDVAHALHANVPMASEECFSLEVPKHKHGVSLNYEALRGVADALMVDLKDGANAVVYANEGASGRYLGPIGDGGAFTLCFRNTVASVGDIVVGFSFHADDPAHEVLSNADATKIQQVQELEDLVYQLSATLDTVKDTQAYMKTIKNYHSQVIASTHSRVLWWSCVEALVLGVVSFSQIAYLRRTLEVRRLL